MNDNLIEVGKGKVVYRGGGRTVTITLTGVIREQFLTNNHKEVQLLKDSNDNSFVVRPILPKADKEAKQ